MNSKENILDERKYKVGAAKRADLVNGMIKTSRNYFEEFFVNETTNEIEFFDSMSDFKRFLYGHYASVLDAFA